MAEYIDQADAKQIIVQLKDGSTWTAEIDLEGKVRLLEMLKDPTTPTEAKPEPEEGEEEAEGEGEPEEQPAEGEEGEGEGTPEEPKWGEEEEGEETSEYTDEDIEKLLNKMADREERRYTDAKTRPIYQTMPKNLLKDLKDSAFRARLSSIMLDNKYDRRVKGRTRGKLDMTRLYKVPTGSRNVFMQKQSRKGKQYNVVLLIDKSGSMSGRPADLAAESAVFLTRELTELGINVGIITFNSRVCVAKDLLEKPDYKFIYSEVASANGGNADYDAMRRAYAMLDKAPEGENIFIMLSDGNPVGYHRAHTYDSHGKEEKILKLLPNVGDKDYVDYDTKEHFHHLVKAHPKVKSIGIGIQEGGWQVPDHEVIHNVGDLKKTIIKQLRKHIQRG